MKHQIADIRKHPKRVTVVCDCGAEFSYAIEQGARNGHSIHREIVDLRAVLNDANKEK